MAAHRKPDRRHVYLCVVGPRKRVWALSSTYRGPAAVGNVPNLQIALARFDVSGDENKLLLQYLLRSFLVRFLKEPIAVPLSTKASDLSLSSLGCPANWRKGE